MIDPDWIKSAPVETLPDLRQRLEHARSLIDRRLAREADAARCRAETRRRLAANKLAMIRGDHPNPAVNAHYRSLSMRRRKSAATTALHDAIRALAPAARSQKEIARAVGCSEATVSRVLNGKQ